MEGRRRGLSLAPEVKAVVEACFQETGLLYTCDIVTCEALSGGTDDERDVIRRLLQCHDRDAQRPRRRAVRARAIEY